MKFENWDPRVDMYVTKAKPFAQPIVTHLRELVHTGCPGVAETIKWSRPFFEHGGVILCNISAFNSHCSFGFWGEEIGAVLRAAGVTGGEGMGTLGRITNLKDLPPDRQMLDWLRQASGFIDRGEYTSPIAARHRVVKGERAPLETPPALGAALKQNKKAAKTFAAFSESCQREYIQWIADAKRADTQEKRIATAMEWLAEGKQRHWKYQAG